MIRAQILNNQGQLQFSQGKPETALETWKKSEKLYKELSDRIGEIGTQLNQARALQVLGFYLRARTTLEQVEASLANQPDSQLKVAGLLNLGNVLRVVGDLTASQKVLQQSLAVAEKLQSTSDIQVASFSLGNVAEAQQQPPAALELYQQAAAENSPVRLQAQIHQLQLLVELNRLADAQKLLPQIQTQLANLPPSQTTIYAQIELAESLIKLTPKESTTAARLLATAQKQAESSGNIRAESYALGRLGRLYEQRQQWEDAKGLTQQALELSQSIRAPEIAYQWHQKFTTAALQADVKRQPFSVLHLATHGQFSSKASETYILTWDKPIDVKQLNTLLTSRDLPNSQPIELLVLSACQTAKGDQRAALGLAGVAVRSGARSTLATLWTVSDESTAEFMEQFYQELLKSEGTKAEAVRQAQLHLLKQSEFSHPYFWAPFILVGNWL